MCARALVIIFGAAGRAYVSLKLYSATWCQYIVSRFDWSLWGLEREFRFWRSSLAEVCCCYAGGLRRLSDSWGPRETSLEPRRGHEQQQWLSKRSSRRGVTQQCAHPLLPQYVYATADMRTSGESRCAFPGASGAFPRTVRCTARIWTAVKLLRSSLACAHCSPSSEMWRQRLRARAASRQLPVFIFSVSVSLCFPVFNCLHE